MKSSKLTRLIGPSSTEVEYYEHHSLTLMMKIISENILGLRSLPLTEEETTTWSLAKSLKQSDAWLGDKFVFEHNTYVLESISASYEQVDLSGMSSIQAQIALNLGFYTPKMIPLLHGSLTRDESVKVEVPLAKVFFKKESK